MFPFKATQAAVEQIVQESQDEGLRNVHTVYPDVTPAPTIGDKCNLVRMVAELGPIRFDEIRKEIAELDKRRDTLSQEAETLGWLIAALHNEKESV